MVVCLASQVTLSSSLHFSFFCHVTSQKKKHVKVKGFSWFDNDVSVTKVSTASSPTVITNEDFRWPIEVSRLDVSRPPPLLLATFSSNNPTPVY